MRRGAIFLGWGGLAIGAAGALEPLAEHVDLVPSFGGGEWSWEIVGDLDDFEPSTVFLPARDLDFPDGERYERPGGSPWDFLGMESGDPLWILPQSDNGFTWPGLENAQSGSFGSYVESDPRVGSIAQPWIRVELSGMEGPGEFSLFQFQSGAPVVWMASADGITAEDTFFLAAGGHSHMSWAFSEKGVYRLELRPAAFLGPGETNPTPVAESEAFYFAVGSRAVWRAGHFPAGSVMDEAVAGDEADADADGHVNLVEYALGTDPLSGIPIHEESGEPAGPELLEVSAGGEVYPALRFFRRVHEDADVSYAVEWSDALDGGWSSEGTEVEIEDFGEDWERVTVRDTRPVSGRRFGRVRVEVSEF